MHQYHDQQQQHQEQLRTSTAVGLRAVQPSSGMPGWCASTEAILPPEVLAALRCPSAHSIFFAHNLLWAQQQQQQQQMPFGFNCCRVCLASTSRSSCHRGRGPFLTLLAAVAPPAILLPCASAICVQHRSAHGALTTCFSCSGLEQHVLARMFSGPMQ
jgi:hypothetical protein